MFNNIFKDGVKSTKYEEKRKFDTYNGVER